jgi:PTS system N-acetylglucosamine-specific IIC component
MSGFFPVMMFGLPAACLAMYRAARPDRRPAVGGMLLSLALTAMLTGVTEPIEFSFMFLAPALYGLHAVLTGLAMVIMDALHVRLGFGFSAGLFDYLLNFRRAQNPLLLFPVGAAYFLVYYGVFLFVIRRFDLATPGREKTPAESAGPARPVGDRPGAFIAALGGAANLASVEACTTRLRLVIVDRAKVDLAALKALGSRGAVWPSERDLQVVLGPQADQVALEIREALGTAPGPQAPPPRTDRPAAAAPAKPLKPTAEALLAALGGAANVRGVGHASSRIRLELADPSAVDEAALRGLGVRAFARPAQGLLHLVMAPGAERLAAELSRAAA